MARIFAIFLLILLPTAVLADRPKADACAVHLAPDAKKIYDAVVPSVTNHTNIRRIAHRQGALLARTGKISSANLPMTILQARMCLRLARPSR